MPTVPPDLDAYLTLLKRDGTLCLVGVPDRPHPAPSAANLVMRRRQAEPAMIVALAGMLVWLVGSLAVAPLRDAMSASDLAVIIVMLIVTWTIFWFARHSRMRGWLQ